MEEDWTEDNSNEFIEFGDFFIPGRSTQLNIICKLLTSVPKLHRVVDLGCGEGKLCQAILEKFENTKVHGLDLSEKMLDQARKNLEIYQERYSLQKFRLEATDWRSSELRADAFVSSLAIHHLDGEQKQSLFKDLFGLLSPGGILVVADIIEPTQPIGFDIASGLWDDFISKKSKDDNSDIAHQKFLDGHWNYFDYPGEDPIDKPSSIVCQLKWLESSGFSKVDVFWMNAGHAIFGGWKE